MRRIVGLSLLLAALSPLGLAGQSSDPEAEAGHPAGLTEWLPSKLPGVSYMPLVGEATRAGAYIYRIRASDGVLIPPHWHTQTMHLTILSGTLVMVMGGSADSSSARRYATGGFLAMPAGMRHMEWFEGETVVHVETQGPFETVFVDPGDDPRSRARP